MRKKSGQGKKGVRGGVIKTFGDHLSLLPIELFRFIRNEDLKTSRKKSITLFD
jgi:hypothetical protein